MFYALFLFCECPVSERVCLREEWLGRKGLDGECVRGVCTGGISQDPRIASSDPRMRE